MILRFKYEIETDDRKHLDSIVNEINLKLIDLFKPPEINLMSTYTQKFDNAENQYAIKGRCKAIISFNFCDEDNDISCSISLDDLIIID